MTKINLLPWRIERRKQREREFYTLLIAAAIAGVLIVILWSLIMGARIENQTQRNTYLQGQIKELDKQIAEIDDLDKTRSRLLTRKNAIEQLQANRSQMVHLFDELVRTIPDGVRLTALKQTGDQLTLTGIAESNTRVASYMRNIDRSPWMGHSDLTKIENLSGTTGADPKLPYKFILDVKLLKAGEQPEAAGTSADDTVGDSDKKSGAVTGATATSAAHPAAPTSTKPAAAQPAILAPPPAMPEHPVADKPSAATPAPVAPTSTMPPANTPAPSKPTPAAAAPAKPAPGAAMPKDGGTP